MCRKLSPNALFSFSWCVTQRNETTYRTQRESRMKLQSCSPARTHTHTYNTPVTAKPRPHTCENQEITLFGPHQNTPLNFLSRQSPRLPRPSSHSAGVLGDYFCCGDIKIGHRPQFHLVSRSGIVRPECRHVLDVFGFAHCHIRTLNCYLREGLGFTFSLLLPNL